MGITRIQSRLNEVEANYPTEREIEEERRRIRADVMSRSMPAQSYVSTAFFADGPVRKVIRKLASTEDAAGNPYRMFKQSYPFWKNAEDTSRRSEAVDEPGDTATIEPPQPPTAIDEVLAEARAAWVGHRAATFDHAMTEPFSAFVLASIERTLAGALADLKRAEELGHREDADFAHETIEMLTANRDAIRAAREAHGWSADGD